MFGADDEEESQSPLRQEKAAQAELMPQHGA
jgi:hypothetical protein